MEMKAVSLLMLHPSLRPFQYPKVGSMEMKDHVPRAIRDGQEVSVP